MSGSRFYKLNYKKAKWLSNFRIQFFSYNGKEARNYNQ